MADSKISNLTSYTTPIDTDVFPVVDVSTGVTKKITLANLKTAMGGYILQFSGSESTVADATTYYFGGNLFAVGSSTSGLNKIRIPRSGTVKSIYLEVRNRGTVGTTETSTVSFRLNDTTDTTITSSFITSTNPNSFSNTALSISVAAGDYFEIKWVTPTYATNPSSVDVWGTVYIE